jgi:predicted nuclease of predicted toxin-antitoxin system
MRLLIDANLSWRLVNQLKADFPEITHMLNAGMAEDTSDTLIWNYAKENKYSIITNDDDFHLLAMAKGFPPKIILLKTGNQSTKYISEILSKHKTDIESFITNEEYGVLELF